MATNRLLAHGPSARCADLKPRAASACANADGGNLESRMGGLRQSLRDILCALQSWVVLPSDLPDERGSQLLALNLSPAQREQYSEHFDFDVIGGDTGRHYRIRHGCAMNVQQLDQNGREVQLLCFVPRDRLPVGDVMLAQKLALELFETDVLRVANRSPAWHTALDAHVN